MNRRALLKRAGAVTGTFALAGCLNDGAGAGGDDGSDGGDSDGSDGGDSDGGDGETTTSEDGGDGESGDGESGDGEETTEASPSLGETSVETTNTDCGSENSATIEFVGKGASLQGKIPASDPCHEAAFADVSLEDGAVTVVVEVVETDADACQQCLGQIEYTARIGVENAEPASVTVKHQAQGETTTVAENSR